MGRDWTILPSPTRFQTSTEAPPGREVTGARIRTGGRLGAPRRPLTPAHSSAFLSQRRKFLQMKRRKYGFIYKTHLFGRPTVRVMGADNVRRILLGEHRLVSVHWPASVRTILGSGCLSNLHDSSHKQRKKVREGWRRLDRKWDPIRVRGSGR